MGRRGRLASAGFALSVVADAFAAMTSTPPGVPAAPGSDAEDLANALDVPRHGVSFLIQNDTRVLTGDALPDPLIANRTSLQPLIPVPVGSMALYVRLYLPLFYNPVPAPALGDDYAFGLGDAGFLAALVPFPEWPLLVAAGPVFLFPTATSKALSDEHFQVGPALGAFYTTPPWFVGVLSQQLWSVGGSAQQVIQNDTQYFILRTLPANWQIGMTPNIFIDWLAPEGERLTLPIGFGVWKAVRAVWPVRFGVELQYSLVKPDVVGQEWNLRVQLTPQIPYPGAGEPAP